MSWNVLFSFLTFPYEQVNFSSGQYFSGSGKDLGSLLPFDAGFEVPEENLVYHQAICVFNHYV